MTIISKNFFTFWKRTIYLCDLSTYLIETNVGRCHAQVGGLATLADNIVVAGVKPGGLAQPQNLDQPKWWKHMDFN